ncbi:MAG TPA: glycosyltransferase family 1 protein [Puia sp.]|nr:glycosyltransferase family 1 protein [Puia sp.]
MARNSKGPVLVTFFHRKPRGVGNYSVEFIFRDVRQRLSAYIEAKEAFSTYESSGVFKRLYNGLEAIGRQGEVNHVTGDINYLGIFLGRKKTIQTILDCVHLSSSTGIRHAVIKLIWVSIPVRRARYVTAISESTKKEILKYVSCDPEKIVVIPVAISERFTHKQRDFNTACPRVLQLGTAPNKNIPRLAEALKGIPCKLDIVGKHDPQLEELLKTAGIDYEYSWGLSEDEILKKYETADIVSLTSTYEGFGMPILEAQATGRPVITSNILSMPEVAGDAACLVDPFDVSAIRSGILKIIQDGAYREELVRKGQENIGRFDPQKIALQYLDLYKKIANR